MYHHADGSYCISMHMIWSIPIEGILHVVWKILLDDNGLYALYILDTVLMNWFALIIITSTVPVAPLTTQLWYYS